MLAVAVLTAITAVVALSTSATSGKQASSGTVELDSAHSGFLQRQLQVSVHGDLVSATTLLASTHARRVTVAGICSRRAGTQWTPFVTLANAVLDTSGTTVSGSRRIPPGQYAYGSCVRRGGVLTVFGALRMAAVSETASSSSAAAGTSGSSTAGSSSSDSSSASSAGTAGSGATTSTGSGAQPSSADDQPPPGALTPEQFGAVGNGRADDTAALQRGLDAVPTGGTLWLAAGKKYTHSTVLKANVAGETIAGPGTVLATDEQNSSFWITANNVTVDGPTFDVASTSKRWDAYEQMGVRVAGVTATVLRDITVKHSAAAGIYIGQGGDGSVSSNFLVDHVTVQDTRADGIHMTGGSHDGTVRSPTISNTGDDGVAVVSYSQDGVVCNHIEVDSPHVLSTAWGRGLSVVGGQYVTYNDINVANTNAAGIYLSNEGAPFNTASTSHVTVNGGTITDANTNANIGHGAILLYSSQAGHTVSDVAIQNLTIRNTPSAAPWEVGIRSDSGAVSDVTFNHLAIDSGNTPFATNVSRSDYSAKNWTVNGSSYSAP